MAEPPSGPVEGVRDRVRETGLLADGAVVLLSGGRDSVCLLDVAVALAGAQGVRALHVDHGLRDDAGPDIAHCEALCAALGVELAVERPRRETTSGNVQAWAREVRYVAGEDHARAAGLPLAAGHTATDQAETILYRLASSPGRRALLGMEARIGRLVRPLLDISREETGAYCAARGLAFLDDPGNAGDRFARGRVRNGLVPALAAVHPAAERNVVRTAELLREEAAVLDALVDGLLDGGGRIGLARLAAQPAALGRLVLRRLAEDATGALCPRAPGRLDEVLALDDGALDLGDGARAEVRGGVLTVGRTPPLPPRRG